MPEEAHGDVGRGGEGCGGSGGEELKGHGAGVVWDLGECGGDDGELSETEKGEDAGVGSELDVESW